MNDKYIFIDEELVEEKGVKISRTWKVPVVIFEKNIEKGKKIKKKIKSNQKKYKRKLNI